MAYLLFLFISLVWGASFLMMKKASADFGPISIAAWRVLLGAAVLFAVTKHRGVSVRLSWRQGGLLFVLAMLGCAWPYSIQPWLVKRHDSAFVAMWVSLVPLLTVLASIPVLRLRPSPRQWIGVTGGLLCMSILLGEGWQRQVPVVQMLFAVSVPACYAVHNLMIRKSLAKMPSMVLTAWAYLMSGLVLLPLAQIAGEPWCGGHSTWPWSVAALAFLGIVGTGLAGWFFNLLVQKQGPLFAGMVTYLVPLGALLWAWLDKEQISSAQIIALIGILAMVALVQYKAAVPGNAAKPVNTAEIPESTGQD